MSKNVTGAFKLPTDMKKNDIDQNVLDEVIKIVTELTGIFIGEKQMPMIENRLKSRMARLQVESSQEYLQFLKQHREVESQVLVSLMTTHHTYFFREFNHFEYLAHEGLKILIARVRARGDKKIRLWSSACSRGQEVYSLAMFLEFHLRQMAPDVTFEIFGTDVDRESVEVARNGVYQFDDLKKVPLTYMNKHWVRGTGDIAQFAKVKDSLKKHCSFDVGNLLQDHAKAKNEKYDVIFCRNVFIYFTPEQVKEITQRLLRSMDSEGFLFVGISETLNGLATNIGSVGPSIYRFKTIIPDPKATTATATLGAPGKTNAPAANVMLKKLKVLCVDDSSTILSLLKKILVPESGFEIVATAMNGKEAAEVLKKTQVDVVTLDIHMPEMDGMTYLKTYMNPKHPPVVMLSSVNRDNADMALKAIELGAFDYIEKPTLSNLAERSEEIRSKLKTAVALKGRVETISSLDKEFKRSYSIKDAGAKTRVVFAGLAQKKSVTHIVKGLTNKDPGTIIVFEGAGDALTAMATELAKENNLPIKVMDTVCDPKPGEIFLVDIAKTWTSLVPKLAAKKNSCMVLGIPTKKVVDTLNSWKPSHLVLEDLGPISDANFITLKTKANGIVPATSYLSISEENF